MPSLQSTRSRRQQERGEKYVGKPNMDLTSDIAFKVRHLAASDRAVSRFHPLPLQIESRIRPEMPVEER